MKISNIRYSVRLFDVDQKKIAALHEQFDASVNHLIRTAVHHYLSRDDNQKSSDRRLAQLTEFNHLALDVIIGEQYPEYRPKILQQTGALVEKYHGAK